MGVVGRLADASCGVDPGVPWSNVVMTLVWLSFLLAALWMSLKYGLVHIRKARRGDM
jgi:hypothetical protein